MNSPLRLVLAVALACGVAACSSSQEQKPEDLLPPAPIVNSFRAQVAESKGAPVVLLTWETQNATRVTITDSQLGEVSGVEDQPAGALQLPMVTKTTLFILTASNARGVSDRAVAQVQAAGEAQTVSFVASPSSVRAGEPVTLAWAAPGAREVSVTTEEGLLDVEGQGTSGAIEVTPLKTTTYTLHVDGQEYEAAVSVEPRLVRFGSSALAARPGDTITLSWTSQGATRVQLAEATAGALYTADQENNPAEVLSGSHLFTLPQGIGPETVFTFTLTVFGGEGSVPRSASTSVYVEGKPRVLSLQAPSYVRRGSTFPLSWTTVSAVELEVYAGESLVYRSPDSTFAREATAELPAPQERTTYTVVAREERGGEARKSIEVDPVDAPGVPQLSATPETLANGGSKVDLTWTAPSARRAVVRDHTGFVLHTVLGRNAESATVSVYPNANTTYTVEVSNGVVGDEPESSSKDVTVSEPASFVASVAGPILTGTPLELTPSLGTAGTPIYGLYHDGVEQRDVSTGFIDIRATGNRLPFEPGDAEKLARFTPVGFSTWAFNRPFSGEVTVSTNGWLRLGPGSDDARQYNYSLPDDYAEEYFIGPYWEDLKVDVDGGVYWQVVERNGEPVLVVQWDRLKFDTTSSTISSSFNFQAQVHFSGVVHFEYREMTITGSTSRGTVGVQRSWALKEAVEFPAFPLPNSGLTFFSPRPAPVQWTAQAGTVTGLVKVASAFVPLEYQVKQLLRPGEVYVSEVMYAPTGAAAAQGEYFEIGNRTDRDIDLTGFSVTDGAGTVLLAVAPTGGQTVVKAGDVLVLGQSADVELNGGVPVDYVYGSALLDDEAGTLSLEKILPADAMTYQAGVNGGPGTALIRDGQPYMLASDESNSTAIVQPHPIECAPTEADVYGSQEPQLRGNPGRLSFCFPYRMSSIPVHYEDISLTGQALATSTWDQQVLELDLSAMPVRLFGQERTKVWLSANGFITVQDAKPSTSQYLISSYKPTSSTPDGTFAILAMDAAAGPWADSNIFLQLVEEDVSSPSPDAHWVIQWHRAEEYLSDDDLNYQMKLFKDGTVEYHYGTMVNGSAADNASGANSVIWVEDTAGEAALTLGYRVPVLTPNSAYRFTP